MRIRKENIRSIKAAEKLPYVVKSNETRLALYERLNASGDVYDLYEIRKIYIHSICYALEQIKQIPIY